MCRNNLWNLSWLGVFAGLALFFVGCPAAQVSQAPVAFWHQRDLEEIRAHFEARLTPNDGATIEGPPFNRQLVFRKVRLNEVQMAEVLESMKHHLKKVVENKGGEVVGRVKEVKEGGAILRSFEFDFRRGKTSGIVRCEVKHTHLHHQHFDLICELSEHQLRPQ